MEATLFFDDFTTESSPTQTSAARTASARLRVKGPDRLALSPTATAPWTCPTAYLFGPIDGGERIQRRDGVGIMPDGKALASGVIGMDHCVRTFHGLTGAPLVEVIRMATLTPARSPASTPRSAASPPANAPTCWCWMRNWRFARFMCVVNS